MSQEAALWVLRFGEEDGVPLSDREQRLFNQIEQSLAADDPRFAATGRTQRSASSRRWRGLGVIAVVVGLGCIVLALAVGPSWGPLVATGGFVLIVAGGFALVRSRPTRPHHTGP